MKRFLVIALCLFALAAGTYLVIYHTPWYLSFLRSEDLFVPYRSQGDTLQAWTGEGYETVTLRGVEISSVIPGHSFSDYAAEEADYLRWLDRIADLGANTVQTTVLMDDDFYNALYAYNTSHADPLWLIQGVTVASEVNLTALTAYESGMLDGLKREGKLVIDAVHGRRDVVSGGIDGSGVYRKDVSGWVIGYVISAELESDNVAYTDHSALYDGSFQGQYFQTSPEATPFEALLAQVLDTMADYETGKYQTQRPMGFLSGRLVDFLEYEPIYARQMQKYACIDPEHILPTDLDQAGLLICYQLSQVQEDFTRYLSSEQRQELGPCLDDLDRDPILHGYLTVLARYHTMPLVAVYSASSARGVSGPDSRPLTETQQGEALAAMCLDLEENGWSGGVISSWQDVWTRRSWNTAFATLTSNSNLWHDLQTDTQNTGLMAFDPGAEPVCVLDGDPAEWTEDDLVLDSGDLRLYARYDARGVYLLLEGAGPADRVVVPIDLAAEAGSRSSRDPDLTFARNADFLLCLEGPDNSRLLVQERYDATRENFLYEIEGLDPFVEVPEAESSRFVPVRMALRNDLLVDALVPTLTALQRLGTWETGRLVCGCGDPEDPDYNSLADVCYAEDLVEIRLPWLLLNVGDPGNMQAHRDYYTHYGVEYAPFRQLWLGAARVEATGEIPLYGFRVKGWESVEYRERLKQSYYVIQALWKDGEADALDG